jgi:GNAT superfamily N-acetyltransferase
MNVRLLDAKDKKRLEDFLAPHKSQSMFICSNLRAAGVEYKNEMFHGEYFGSFCSLSGNLNGVIVHYWNGNIMMFASNLSTLSHLVLILKQNIKRSIIGILGPDNQAKLVIKELGLVNEDYEVNSKEGLYELHLEKLDQLHLPPGFKIIDASRASKDTLIKWIENYEIEALCAERNIELVKRVENKVDRLMKSDCLVLIKDGIAVSLSAFNARIEGMVQIGPVWTPPEYRNQGFSRLLVASSLLTEKNNGTKAAILFANNPAAVRSYESIGFKIIGDYRLAILKKECYL